jgi:hypothetical protein
VKHSWEKLAQSISETFDKEASWKEQDNYFGSLLATYKVGSIFGWNRANEPELKMIRNDEGKDCLRATLDLSKTSNGIKWLMVIG